MKKVLAWIVCVGMILSCITVPAAAQPSYEEDWFFYLTGYGVLDGTEMTDAQLDQNITRGEYSELIAKLFGLRINLSLEGDFPYTDVLPSESCYPSVAALAAYGLISKEENLFRPGEAILGSEGIKILVSALGYSPAAEASGGYPTGYLNMAGRLGLRPSAPDQALTWRETVRILDRALDAAVMEEDGYGSGNFLIQSQKYLRDVIQGPNGEEFLHGYGILNADYLTYLDQPVSNLGKNEVVIDNLIFDAGATGARSLLGDSVEYLALYDEKTDTARLTAVRADKKTREVRLDADDFLGASGDKLSYVQENGETKKVSYDKFAKVVRNNRMALSYEEKDITVQNGSVRLVDNDEDGSIDIIFIRDYVSTVISRTAGDTLYFEVGEGLDGNQSLILEQDNPDMEYLLQDAEGKEIKLEDIGAGDVASILRSGDGEVYEIIVSNEKASGVAEQVTELDGGVSEIVIGGEAYRTEKGRTLDFQVGDTVDAKLNFEKRIVQVNPSVTKKQYGYLFGCAENGMDGYMARILVAGKLQEEVKVDDTDPDNPINIPYLKVGNSDVLECRVADKAYVRLDGGRMDFKEYIKFAESRDIPMDPKNPKINPYRVIEYSINGKGEIKTIDIPERCGTGEERTYNSYEKTFGKLGDAFAANEQTGVICVPTNDVSDRRNLLSRIEMDENNQKYTISGYDLDEETDYASLVVLMAGLNADAVLGTLEISKPAVAEEVATILDDEGNNVKQVTFWSEGKKMTYPVAESKMSDPAVKELRSGTVFHYTKNLSEELFDVKVLRQLDEELLYYYDSANGQLVGRINAMQYKKLDMAANRFVHQLMVATSEDGADIQPVKINVRNQPPIYCYSKRGSKSSVSIVEPEALRAGEFGGDEVFVGLKNGETEIVVVVD